MSDVGVSPAPGAHFWVSVATAISTVDFSGPPWMCNDNILAGGKSVLSLFSIAECSINYLAPNHKGGYIQKKQKQKQKKPRNAEDWAQAALVRHALMGQWLALPSSSLIF